MSLAAPPMAAGGTAGAPTRLPTQGGGPALWPQLSKQQAPSDWRRWDGGRGLSGAVLTTAALWAASQQQRQRQQQKRSSTRPRPVSPLSLAWPGNWSWLFSLFSSRERELQYEVEQIHEQRLQEAALELRKWDQRWVLATGGPIQAGAARLGGEGVRGRNRPLPQRRRLRLHRVAGGCYALGRWMRCAPLLQHWESAAAAACAGGSW